MAIIYSYPLNDNIKPLDELVGTTEKNINGQLKTVTRNFLLQDLAEFLIIDGGLQKTIILTTDGNSGPSTLDQVTGILNIPQYSGGGSQDLQSVTDEGETTTNNIQFINSAEVMFGAGGGILLDNTSRLREGTIDAGLGGSKGIAQICGVGYELKWEAGRLYVMNGNGNGIRESLYNFNIVPTVDDDNTKAYYQGSLWSLDNGDVYECSDATTGAAVWFLKSTGSTPNLQDVTDIGANTTNGINIDTEDTYEIGLYAISSAIGIKGESRETYGVYGFSPSSAGVYGTSENAYGVQGYSESGAAVYGSTITGYGIESYSYSGRAISATSDIGTGLFVYSEDIGASIYSNGIGLQLNGNGTIAIDVILGNLNKGLVINSGTSSTGNFIELAKNSVNKLVVNQQGELTATKLIKEGGFDYQFLKADGSVDNNTYLTSADLPSTLDLYATTSPDPVISGYTALVRNIADPRYNTVAVDVLTPTITGTLASPTFCGAVISDPSILLGNPGVFNFSVIGKIRRSGGSTSSGADFFYGIYKRDLAGVETLIANSAPVVVPANGGIYVEYISVALWNNGIFLSTDRVVLKFYGVKTGGGTGATYEFQFGGTDPVRGTAAISSAIIPNIYLKDLADVEKTPALNNEVLYWNDSASLWEHSLVENLVPDASATQKGLVTTGTQTFAGDKTFSGSITSGSIVASSLDDYGVSATSTNSDAISAESTDGRGVFGSSINGLGGYFNTVNGANIAEFTTNFVEKAKIDSDGLITGTGLNASGQTINTIASFDASKNVVSLPTATYPSLTELTYVKGVTSGIQTQLNGKQDTLQNTVNIKSINGNSILGSGDLTILGTGISSLNGLTGATQTFSATTNTSSVTPTWSSSGTNHQLNIPIAGGATTTGLITGTSQSISGSKQFKSNPEIPVPAGNTTSCIVLGSAGGGGATGTLQIGSTTLYPTALEMQYVKGITSSVQTQLDSKASIIDVAEQTYSLSPTFTVTAPTTIVANTYKWNQVGSLVTVRVNLSYTTAGSFNTVVIPLPTDMPTPLSPTGFTAASDILYYGTGSFTTTTSNAANLARVTFLRRNSANNGYEFVMLYSTAIAARVVTLTLQYFT